MGFYSPCVQVRLYLQELETSPGVLHRKDEYRELSATKSLEGLEGLQNNTEELAYPGRWIIRLLLWELLALTTHHCSSNPEIRKPLPPLLDPQTGNQARYVTTRICSPCPCSPAEREPGQNQDGIHVLNLTGEHLTGRT